MFARVSTYQAPDADKVVEGFRSVTDALKEMDGFSHAYFLVDRASGKAISITVWESEQALSASPAKADELRKRGSEVGGSSIQSVEHYGIRATAAGTPTTAG